MKMINKDPNVLKYITASFNNAKANRYANVGKLFDFSTLQIVEKEIINHISLIPSEMNMYASKRKHRLSDIQKMPKCAAELVSYLNSPDFLEVLSNITGIKDLHPDPELHGGGIHAIGKGGFLKLHTDFNWHSKLSMHRRLNLLVYLNDTWPVESKGQVELWDETCSKKVFSLNPSLGNALLFETTDTSYHGHPDPLMCPEGTFRKSIALYYYTIDRPDNEVVFGSSKMTNFVERPGEKFGGDKIRRVRHKLQFKLKKVSHFFGFKN